MSDKQCGLIKTVIISIAIIIVSLILCSAIKEGTHYIGDAIGKGLNYIPIGGNLSVDTTPDGTSVFREYMSEYEASTFLMVNIDDFKVFIKSGELDGTFTTIQGGYVFSKEKLTQWLEKRIENE